MARRRRNDFLIPTLGVLFDAAAVEGAFLLAWWLRFRTPWLSFLPLTPEAEPPFRGYALGSLVIVPVWLLLFKAGKLYGARRNAPPFDDAVTLAKLVTLGMLIVMSAAFFYRAFSYSRVVFGLLWLLALAFLICGRFAVRGIEKALYRGGKGLRNAVILGSTAAANRVFHRLHDHPLLGYRFAGYLADRESLSIEPLGATTWLGRLDDVPARLREHGVELVIVALEAEDHDRLAAIVRECEGMNVEFLMVPDFLELMSSRMAVTEIEGIPFIRLKGIPMTTWGRIAKRSFDLAVGSALLALTSPLLLLAALLVKLGSPGPVLFVQERIGIDGAGFRMLKFRSMRRGAEEHDRMAGLGLQNDPRTTAVGRILRRMSIDELPQLINVVKGEMSLVGPRPERPYFVDRFKNVVPKYLDRHRVKTGMTGWAQVNGLRGDSSLEERIKYDVYYIENWSIGFDVKILLKTFRAIFG